MAHQARSSGSRLVAGAVAGTLGVVGLSTIYLPFFADRDTIRGLHEEEAPPTSHMLAQEIRKLQQEGILRGDEEEEKTEAKKAKAPGSMWSNLRK